MRLIAPSGVDPFLARRLAEVDDLGAREARQDVQVMAAGEVGGQRRITENAQG
ncbi:hypothetical protein [Pseudomonas aeruginosa]|uniref:hypothetical protein n=1 Tax=Pseudomonas aeruginosa TaxID=287 RepID=UPI003D9C54C4